jgi:Ca-activated chloride channel family protein
MFNLADRSILAAPGARLGAAEYIPTPQDAVRIFDEVYQSMQVVAQDVLLTLRMVQGVEARRVWQAAPMIRDLGRGVLQGRSVQVEVGQLEKGGAAFLMELMLPPRPAGAVRVAQADVTYRDIDGQPQRQAADLIVQYTPDPDALNDLNGQVMNVVEKVQAFKLQTQALEDAQAGSVEHATRKLRQAVTILLNQGENDLAGQMKEEADRLEQSGEISSEGKKTILLTSRKTVRLSDD